jgi:hypothetical protein
MTAARRAKLWMGWTAALGLAAALSCTGCQLYRNLGSGVRYDVPEDKPADQKSKLVRHIVVAVTTNAAGQVTLVQFIRSSGLADHDQYVADSLRANWSGAPSTRSVVSLTYSGEKGFSVPKLLSTTPAPASGS